MDICGDNQCAVLTDQMLEKFENILGARLPDDYRNYLKTIDEKNLKQRCFTIASNKSESRIHHIYVLNNGPDFQRLDKMLEIYSDRIPHSFLPFADDAFGNVLCIGIDKKNYGNIYFWNHELGKYKENKNSIEQIAYSFTDFIGRLHPCHVVETNDVITAIKENDIDFILRLIEGGYDVETEDEYGRTLIENAAIFNSPEIIQILHDNGAKLINSLDYAMRNLEFFPDHKKTVNLIKKLMNKEQ